MNCLFRLWWWHVHITDHILFCFNTVIRRNASRKNCACFGNLNAIVNRNFRLQYGLKISVFHYVSFLSNTACLRFNFKKSWISVCFWPNNNIFSRNGSNYRWAQSNATPLWRASGRRAAVGPLFHRVAWWLSINPAVCADNMPVKQFFSCFVLSRDQS